MDVTREHISHILELREILLSFQTDFSLVKELRIQGSEQQHQEVHEKGLRELDRGTV